MLGLGSDETIVLGRYIRDDSSEWKPYTITYLANDCWFETNPPPMPRGTASKSSPVLGNPCVRLAAWVVPVVHSIFKGILAVNIHVDRYQKWGNTMLVPRNAFTQADIIEFAQKSFGSHYYFGFQGHDLYVTNPDHAFNKVPQDAHHVENPEVTRYARYIARLQAMERLPYKFGVPQEIIDGYGTGLWGYHLCPHNRMGSLTLIDSIKKWSSRALVLLHKKTLREFLDIQAVKREVHTTLPTPCHLLENRHRKIVARLDSLKPPSSLAYDPEVATALSTAMPRVTLRPEQSDVLMEMMRREKEDALEDKLFVKISENDHHELFYAPFFSSAEFGMQVHGYRPRGTASCHFGGLVVADVGWGKTVLALSLMAATPGTKTLVVVPTKDLALQWKGMADSMTTLSSEVYTAKKCKVTPPTVTVDIIFVTYSMIKLMDAFVFDRVVYDEIHEIKTTQWKCLEKCTATWGLTATLAEKKNPKIVGSIVANLIHYNPEYLSYNYMPLFVEMLTIKAKTSSVPVTWEQREPVVSPISMPEAYKTLYDDLITDLANNHWTPESRTAITKCHAVASGAGVYHVPPRVAVGATEGADSTTRKRRFMPDTLYDSEECPICKEQPTQPAVLSCGHCFCEACVSGWIKRFYSCPMCRQQAGRTLPLERVLAHLEQPTEDHEAIHECVDGWSTCRAVRVAELLQEIPPEDTVVVFSLYEPNLCALAAALKQQDIEYAFGTKKTNVKVLLLNLATHNAGLNLQHANHCIFMEKPLDEVSYTQAIGRVSRAGQTKDVYITILQDKRFDV